MRKTAKVAIAAAIAAVVGGVAVSFAIATKKAINEINQIRFDLDDFHESDEVPVKKQEKDKHQYCM